MQAMKPYLYIRQLITIFIGGLAVCGCHFLDEKPRDFLAPANFYKTEADAVAAVNAVYSHLSTGAYYGGNSWRMGDLASDLLDEGAVSRTETLEMNTYTIASTNAIVADFWQRLYVAINQANAAIERVPATTMDASRKARLVAEVRFLRGLFYFDLVKAFGDIPLQVQETQSLNNLNVMRRPAAEVYAQIIQDLQEAEKILPVTYAAADVGRATKGAAQSLLAKVYLYKNDYAAAAQKAQEVVQSGTYSLVANFADIWPAEKENSSEHIFSVQYKAGVVGSGFNETFGVRGGKAPITGGSSAFVKRSFFNSFEAGDVRKDVSIKDSYTFPDGSKATFQPHVWKYFNPNGLTPSNTDTNWPVIRYAEVLLILAEARNEINGPDADAYAAINQVRRRAKLKDLATGLTKDSFRDAVLQERGWELCFEGHRRYDLVRMGKLQARMQQVNISTTIPKHNLYPIPQRELDTNRELKQNPGY